MKAIIPVKDNSTRVPSKNFKPFYGDKCLFDITVEKLSKVLNPSDIYMSCENEERKPLAEAWGINFLLRDKRLTDNNLPFYDFFNGICDQVPGDDDIAWCHATDPLFNSYKECFDVWQNGVEVLECGAWTTKSIRKRHDSLVVVYPQKDHLLDDNYNPIGFGFGAWHKISQALPTIYQLGFSLSILTRDCINKNGYYIGKNPYWYHARNKNVDIDTPEDFELAQAMYTYYANKDK